MAKFKYLSVSVCHRLRGCWILIVHGTKETETCGKGIIWMSTHQVLIYTVHLSCRLRVLDCICTAPKLHAGSWPYASPRSFPVVVSMRGDGLAKLLDNNLYLTSG